MYSKRFQGVQSAPENEFLGSEERICLPTTAIAIQQTCTLQDNRELVLPLGRLPHVRKALVVKHNQLPYCMSHLCYFLVLTPPTGVLPTWFLIVLSCLPRHYPYHQRLERYNILLHRRYLI